MTVKIGTLATPLQAEWRLSFEPVKATLSFTMSSAATQNHQAKDVVEFSINRKEGINGGACCGALYDMRHWII
jgi:hypothetical protein